MILILILALGLLCVAIVENQLHLRNLEKIPLRIHVNGTRGKSTTTRLIAGALRAGGYQVVAKTTGSAARLILEDGSEQPIKRRKPPTITEQIKIIATTAKRQADVLVIECMAIKPELQWVSEKRIIQAQIGVLTNVREDHQDEMGTSLEAIATTLALAIPKNGHLVLGESNYAEIFQKEAQDLNTTISYAKPARVTAEDLAPFPYLMFPENVACALEVARLLGISKKVALQGMYSATADLGSTKIFKLNSGEQQVFLINALAANDPSSIKLVWKENQEFLQALKNPTIVGLLHNRLDRSYRVEEFVQIACDLPLQSLVLTGELKPLSRRLLKKQGFTSTVSSLYKDDSQRVIEKLTASSKSSTNSTGELVIFAYGNIKGFGEEFLDYFQSNGEEVGYAPNSDGFRISL